VKVHYIEGTNVSILLNENVTAAINGEPPFIIECFNLFMINFVWFGGGKCLKYSVHPKFWKINSIHRVEIKVWKEKASFYSWVIDR